VKTETRTREVAPPPTSPAGADARQQGRRYRIAAVIRPYGLPTMVAALVLYVVLHSPLRSSIASLFGYSSADCYPCGGTPGIDRFADSAAALFLILVAGLAAMFAASRLVEATGEKILAFGLLTLGFIVVPSALLGALGSALGTGLLRPPGGPMLAALPALATLVVALRRGWRPSPPPDISIRPRGFVGALAALAGGLVLSSVVISLMHPPTQGDALGYHAPLGVFLWSDGNLTGYLDRSPDVWALAHPGTAELWFGLLRVLGGERLSDLGQLPFALLAAFAVGLFTLRLGLRRGAALLAACAFLLSPLVLMQVGMQANDLLGAAVLMATMALAFAPVATWEQKRLLLIGLGLGLTATTKIALLPSVGALALFVVVALWRRFRGRGARELAKLLAVGLLAFAVVVAPWWARDAVRFHNPIYPGNLPVLGKGVRLPASERIDKEFVPSKLAWPLYPLLEPQDDRSGFGTLFIVGVIPGLVLACLRARRQPLLVYGTVTLLTLPAWWSFTLHEPRFLIASFGFAFAFLPWSLLLVRKRVRKVAVAVFVAAAIFSTIVTLDQALIPFARQPTARSEFYDRVWGVDPVASSLPSRDGMLLHTGYGLPFSQYAAYYPLLGDSLEGRRIVAVDSYWNYDTADIVSRMRREHLRYAYVSAVPADWAAVSAIYDRRHFRLVHESAIVVGKQTAARRYLYRHTALNDPRGTRRYLFELRSRDHPG
jgi:hypothetical protein